jgi:phage tail-like protein
MLNRLLRPEYPYLVFKFRVEIDGIGVGGFTEVSGIEAKIELNEEVKEGGMHIRRFPTGVKYNDLVLKRGLASSDYLWNWFQDVASAKVRKKTVAVTLMDKNRFDLWTWEFVEAFPVEWVGPALNSRVQGDSALAIEKIVLTHQGMKGYRNESILRHIWQPS